MVWNCRIGRAITVLVSCWFTSGDAGAAPPSVEQVHLYTSGEGGYHTYRIPALIVTRTGSLLAFCEGRRGGRGDAGDIDLLVKRSTDGGKTWSPAEIVWDDGPNTCGNPCPVVDRRTGTVWLPMTHNLGSDTEDRIIAGTSRGTRTAWITRSDDDGVSWRRPVSINAQVKRPDWTWYATGPGVGIQLRGGRLVIPCDSMVAGTGRQQAHVILSDDGGRGWRIGGVVGPKCDECQVAELGNGSLLLNIRSYSGHNRRFTAISRDGGESFSKPREDPTLIEPVCQASLISLDGPGGSDTLLFSNPAATRRERLTVRMSLDSGKSWSRERLLHAGPAAYSCLAVLPDGSVACLYERGEKSPYDSLTFARFPRELVADAGLVHDVIADRGSEARVLSLQQHSPRGTDVVTP